MSTDAFLSLFTDPGEAERPDPVRAAQAGMKPVLPRRFWRQADVKSEAGLHHLILDGKLARTPARNPVAVGSRPVAEAVAAEWNAVGEVLDPSAMPLTRLANAAIDGVAREADAVRAEIVRYAGSDLVCYRAEQPEALVERQNAAWDPIIDWTRAELGARMKLAAGVVHIAQDGDALAGVAEAVAAIPVPLPLAALSSVTALTGSALLALALAKGFRSPDEVWEAAHVDEAWQADVWGRDDEAEARLAARRRDFSSAAFVLLDQPK